MHIRHVVIAIVIATGVGVAVGWHLSKPAATVEAGSAQPTGTPAMSGEAAGASGAPGAVPTAGPTAGTSRFGLGTAPTAVDTSPSASAATLAGQHVPMTGPASMTTENGARVRSVVDELRARDPHLDDLYTLLEREGRDPAWSDAAEAQLAAFVRDRGAHLTDLQLEAPRCSVTVCELLAIARPGLDTEAARANWQRLLGDLFSQDWFGRTFEDPRMAMTVRDDAVVYVTTLTRADADR